MVVYLDVVSVRERARSGGRIDAGPARNTKRRRDAGLRLSR
jgi:hypothetical protein